MPRVADLDSIEMAAFRAAVRRLLEKGWGMKDLARAIGLAPSSLYNAYREERLTVSREKYAAVMTLIGSGHLPPKAPAGATRLVNASAAGVAEFHALMLQARSHGKTRADVAEVLAFTYPAALNVMIRRGNVSKLKLRRLRQYVAQLEAAEDDKVLAPRLRELRSREIG